MVSTSGPRGAPTVAGSGTRLRRVDTKTNTHHAATTTRIRKPRMPHHGMYCTGGKNSPPGMLVRLEQPEDTRDDGVERGHAPAADRQALEELVGSLGGRHDACGE